MEIQVCILLFYNLRTAFNLHSLLRNCPNLKVLDISNCKKLNLTQILEIFTQNNCLNLQYLDITGIGRDTFEDLDKFHDYWFQGEDLINDLGKLSLLLPNTAINPSVCLNCQRNTCYPSDNGLTCLFCKENVVWVCV